MSTVKLDPFQMVSAVHWGGGVDADLFLFRYGWDRSSYSDPETFYTVVQIVDPRSGGRMTLFDNWDGGTPGVADPDYFTDANAEDFTVENLPNLYGGMWAAFPGTFHGVEPDVWDGFFINLAKLREDYPSDEYVDVFVYFFFRNTFFVWTTGGGVRDLEWEAGTYAGTLSGSGDLAAYEPDVSSGFTALAQGDTNIDLGGAAGSQAWPPQAFVSAHATWEVTLRIQLDGSSFTRS